MLFNEQLFMQQALSQAELALGYDEVPVGALVVHRGEVISADFNHVITNTDPSAHAEILVIREAAKTLNTVYLNKCDLFVTLEPCAMCAQAISFARIRRLYFAAYDLKGGGVENGARIFNTTSCHHVPEVYGGIKEKEAAILLKSFFLLKRKKTPTITTPEGI